MDIAGKIKHQGVTNGLKYAANALWHRQLCEGNSKDFTVE